MMVELSSCDKERTRAGAFAARRDAVPARYH